MNNSLALELQPQLIEGDGDLVKGKIFIAQVVDIQSPSGGNPTEQKTKGNEASLPESGETETGVKILTTTQYKIYICSLHSNELNNEDLPWATPYWVNSNLGSTTIPSPRFAPGSFVYCFEDLKSRNWYIEAACPNQLSRLDGDPAERCKAFSGFTQENVIIPESSTQTQATNNAQKTSTTSTTPSVVAEGAETQNTVPTTADEKQNAPREPGEDVDLPKACKEAARTASFGLNNEITKLIKDIEKFKANNPLTEAQNVIEGVQGQLNSAASTITNYLSSLVQEMKAFILRKVSTTINSTVTAILPNNARYYTNDGTDKALDQISCIFDKILEGLINQVAKLLNSLISKLVNSAFCVVEGLISNFLGQLLGSIMGMINNILSGISGAIGQISSVINEVLDFVISILQLLTCEPEPQCASIEKYNFLEGPDTTDALDLGSIFEKAKGIAGTFSSLDFSFDPETFNFDFDVDNAVRNTLEDCYAGPQQCGPPGLSLYGGKGVGGAFNAVLDENGQLFGFDIVNGGSWSSRPKGKVKDTCGSGSGAIIGDIIIGDIPEDDKEGSSDVANIEIIRQPENIDTKKGKKVTFKVTAKIRPTDGKKLYRWYYSPDLGNNFVYIANNNKNTLDVDATEKKDNWLYVVKIFDDRPGLKKKNRAPSVISQVVRLNLTDVSSPGDDDFDTLKPKVRLTLSKNTITKNKNEKSKVSWSVEGEKIRDVRFTEIRKYKTGKIRRDIYTTPRKKSPARSGFIFVCPPCDATYKITATNAFGTAQKEKDLEVKFIQKKCQFDIKQSLSKPEISDNGVDNARLFWQVKENDLDINTFTVTGVPSPNMKGNVVVQPVTDTEYTVLAANEKGRQRTQMTLSVGTTSFSSNPPQAPSACLSLNSEYIQRDGRDSADLKCVGNGNGFGITNVALRDLNSNDIIFSQNYLGPSYPKTFEDTFLVQPKQDNRYQLTVNNTEGSALAIISLDTIKERNCGSLVLGDEGPEDEPGKPKDDCPPGFEFNRKLKKCVRKNIRDPWLPPPLFPPGIIRVPVITPGQGYDPTITGKEGGDGRVWKGKCEVSIERVNGDWEVIGIGSEYKLYLGDTVYLPERKPVTLGVPNGTRRHNNNVIKWENLTKEEIEKQIPGAIVYGEPYRIQDMSGFDDSRGSEIFKEVSQFDIKPIGIKGKRVAKGIYFDMTEFAEFQTPDITFVAGNRSADKTFHSLKIPEIGLFTEDSGRTLIKDVQGGGIFGPLKAKSKAPVYGKTEIEVPIDVNAEGWNGPGLYYEVLNKDGKLDVDFTVEDSNFGVNNSIRIPGVGNFVDQSEVSRVEKKKVAAPKMYGPITSSGVGQLYIGGKGPAGDRYNDKSVILGVNDTNIALFTDEVEPQLQVLQPATINFEFINDDDAKVAGIAMKNVRIIDPETNQVLFNFDYKQERDQVNTGDITFPRPGIYRVEYDPSPQLQPIERQNGGRRLKFLDGAGSDENASIEITSSRSISATFMAITADKGRFRSYKSAPKVQGTKTVKQSGIVGFDENIESLMYLETETPQGKQYAYGTEGEFDATDTAISGGGKDVIRYYENTDSSRTVVISQGKDIKLDMILRCSEGVFKRYNDDIRMWRFDVEYKKAKDLGFSNRDIRWHLEHVFKSGTSKDYNTENIIDEKMEKKLRDPNFGPLPQNFNNVKDMSDFDPQVAGPKSGIEAGRIGFGYMRDYPYARSLGFSDADIRYYLTEVFQQKFPTGRIGPRMKAKLMDPTFGVFSFNPTFKINVGRPGLFDCENDYPYAQSLGFGDVDIRFFLQYVYKGLVDECMKKKLEDPNWGRIPDFRVEVTSRGCKDPCEGVVCPEGFVCKDGKCIPEDDPCVGVECPDGFKCVNGECVPEKPSYPIVVTLCGITIENPGFGYDSTKDSIVVDPPKGVKIIFETNSLGQLVSVEVVEPGIGFTRIPTITVKSETGKNAVLRPEFCFYPPNPDPPDDDDDDRCPEGQVFDPVTERCVPACPPGQILKNGECVDDPCAGVICDEGYICKDGECVPDPCYGVVCPPGFTCKDGKCVPDNPTIPPDTPVVRVTDCVGKLNPPSNSGSIIDGGGDDGNLGKEVYAKPKREVCN